jgi:ElaB/YqjD/DUF883 family membrane-anchored ribosome-binding protein
MTSMTPQDTHDNPGTAAGGTPSSGGAEGAKAKAANVAEEGAQQAGRLADDVRHEVRDATHRTIDDVRAQADERAHRAADELRTWSHRAEALAAGRTEEAGNLGDIVQRFGRQADDFANRLDTRGLHGVMDDVARFGRNRPLTFLAIAAGTGFVAGRLIRAVADTNGGGDDQSRRSTGMHGGNGVHSGPVGTAASAGIYQDEYTGGLQ